MKIIICLSVFFLFAHTSLAAQGSSLQAYKLAKETKWQEANVEAKRATESNPNDAEAWFLLGLTEERLENLDPALKAYEKYLSLSPAPGAAKNVEENLVTLRERVQRQTQDRYNHKSNGLFFEKSLSYGLDFVDEVSGDMDAPFAIGFKFSFVSLGYRRASGTYKQTIKVPDETLDPPTYNAVPGGGDLIHQELFANFDLSLVDPYTKWGGLQLTMPFTFAGFNNYLEDSSGTKYGNIGFDLGLGLGLRGYTRSAFSWYAQGIYHLGLPFWGPRESGATNGIRDANDVDLDGNVGGFELTAGIIFLFESKTSGHY